MTVTRFYFGISLPCLLVLIGILLNNQRMSDTNKRIDDLRAEMRADHSETMAKIAELEDRVTCTETRG